MKRVETIHGLGPLQQGMVFQAASGGVPGLHLVQSILLLDGVDPDRLRRAFEQMVDHHAALRTGYTWEATGNSLAVVMRGLTLPWSEENWCALSDAERAARLEAYLAEDRTSGFELTRPPLMRVLLARESEQGWRLVLTHHHVLIDGWSLSLLFDELAERYRHLGEGTSFTAANAPDYPAYLAWLDEIDPAPTEAWWRVFLDGAADCRLPDLLRGSGAGMHTTSEVVPLSIWEDFSRLCRHIGVTPAAATAALWGLLLSRLTGENDVTFGVTVSTRPEQLPGIERMVGLLINTVPMRMRLDEGMGLAPFLAQVQSQLGQVRDHAHVSLARIQRWTSDAKPDHRLHLDTLFVFENYPAAEAASSSTLGVSEAWSREEAGFAATLLLEPGGAGLTVSLMHDRARLDDSHARLIVTRFHTLLRAVAEGDPLLPLRVHDHRTAQDRAAAQAGLVIAATERPAGIGEAGLIHRVGADGTLQPTGERGRLRADGSLAPDVPAELAAAAAAATATVFSDGPVTSQESLIAAAMAEALGVSAIGGDDDFLALGGDSIISLKAAALARKAGILVAPDQFLTLRTPRSIALAACETTGRAMADEPHDAAAIPLGAIQEQFFAQERRCPDHFNQALLFVMEPGTNRAALQDALAAVELAHPSLRLRFHERDRGFVQELAAPTGLPLEHVDLSGVPDAEVVAAVTARCETAQASLSLALGPCARAVWFDLGPARDPRLLIVIHHLCVDGVSWRILLDDLAQAYDQAEMGRVASLPREEASFASWTRAVRRYARSPDREADWRHWLDIASADHWQLPRDGIGESRTGNEQVLEVALSADETERLLRGEAARKGTGINAFLLGTLGYALTGAAGGALRISVEGHGRESLGLGLDLSRTVGWFTSLYPVLIKIAANATPGQAVESARAALARPDAGVSYGLLRYCSDDHRARQLAEIQSDVLFNYLGQLDSIVSAYPVKGWARESTGRDEAAGEQRQHALEINAQVTNGCLKLAWAFDPSRNTEATIAHLAHSHLAAIRSLLELSTGTDPHSASGLSGDARTRLLARVAARQAKVGT